MTHVVAILHRSRLGIVLSCAITILKIYKRFKVLGKNQTELVTYLQDLARYGVTDFAADIPFDFATAPQKVNMAPVAEKPAQATPAAPAKPAAPWEQPVSSVPVSQPKAQQPVKLAEPKVNVAEGMVWALGADASSVKIQVLVYNKTQEAPQPFTEEATKLFAKMMAAISVEMSSIAYVLHSDTVSMEEKITQNIASDKPLLIVGQDSAEALTGKTLSVLRGDLAVEGFANVGVVAHPNLLLKQPVLKRVAWQDLLKFKELCEGTDS